MGLVRVCCTKKLHFVTLKQRRLKPACASKQSYQGTWFCSLGCKRVSCCIQTDTSEQIAATIVDAKHIHVFTGQVLPYIWLLLYHTSGYCFTIHLANVYHTSGYCFTIDLAIVYHTSGYRYTVHLAIVLPTIHLAIV